MGKATTETSRVRSAKVKGDPIADQLVVANAKTMLFGNIVTMGLRLAVMVLIPIFIGVQLDKKFDSAPSLTLAAFFIAIFNASLLIYRTYVQMMADTAASDRPKARRFRKLKRSKNA